jgi:hypothetical protein
MEGRVHPEESDHCWTGEAYEGVREHGQGATCLRLRVEALQREAAPAKTGHATGRPKLWRRHGGVFQHSP